MKQSPFALSFLLLLSLVSAACIEEDPSLEDGPVPIDMSHVTSIQQALDLGWHYAYSPRIEGGGSNQQFGLWWSVSNYIEDGRGVVRGYATIGSETPPTLVTGLMLAVCYDNTHLSYAWQELFSDHNHDTSPELGWHALECPPGVAVYDSMLIFNIQQ
jgi:hypothetical protein